MPRNNEGSAFDGSMGKTRTEISAHSTRKQRTSYGITIVDKTNSLGTVRSLLRRGVQETLRAYGVTRVRIALVVVDDSTMAQLNLRYLGHKGPTDVLTFDLLDAEAANSAPYEVDAEIVISIDRARAEAALREHGLSAELVLYTVHGILHLLGFDDRSGPARAKMRKAERRVLQGMGLGDVFDAKGAQAKHV